MLDGWCKEDLPMAKRLLVEADVPEYFCQLGSWHNVTALEAALGDFMVLAFYYLLHVGNFTCNSCRNTTKQSVQFNMEDVTFFTHQGEWLCHLQCYAADKHILLLHDS